MPVYPFDNRPLHWNRPASFGGGGGTFRPQGKIRRVGSETWFHNPSSWRTQRTVTARLVVGFSVGDTGEAHTMDELIAIVERARIRQAGNPASSFVAQKGIYQHRDGKAIVHEDGAQVWIINLSGVSDDDFERHMVELAEEIAREFQQEEVIVEIQVNGISQMTMGVGP